MVEEEAASFVVVLTTAAFTVIRAAADAEALKLEVPT
jgi:hypothetical protein